MTNNNFASVFVDMSWLTWNEMAPQIPDFVHDIRSQSVNVRGIVAGDSSFSTFFRRQRIEELLIPFLGLGVVGLVTDRPEEDVLKVIEYASAVEGSPTNALVAQVIGSSSSSAIADLAEPIGNLGVELAVQEGGINELRGSSSTIAVIEGLSSATLLETMKAYSVDYARV